MSFKADISYFIGTSIDTEYSFGSPYPNLESSQISNNPYKTGYSSLFTQDQTSTDYESFAEKIFDLIRLEESNSSSSNQDFKDEGEDFVRNVVTKFLRTLEFDTLEIGMNSKCEEFIRESLEVDPLHTKEALNKLFLKNINNDKVVLSILHTISHIDYDLIYPEGQTMALACFSNKDLEIREYAIRAFENWACSSSLDILESQRVSPAWLDDYRKEVIEDIKGIIDVKVSTKN